MFNTSTFRTFSISGFLALAIAAYVVTNPNEGLLSGPSTVSALLQTLPLVSF